MAWVEKTKKGFRYCDRIKVNGETKKVHIQMVSDSPQAQRKAREALQTKYQLSLSAVNQKERQCYLYFILANDMVKIGISNDPNARLKCLQTSNGSSLKIFHLIQFDTRKQASMAEKYLHHYFMSSMSDAQNEWFSKEIIQEVITSFWTKDQLLDAIKITQDREE